MPTELMDRFYLEYSQITSVLTAKEKYLLKRIADLEMRIARDEGLIPEQNQTARGMGK